MTRQSIQHLGADLLDRHYFDKGIAWLEALKQENFSAETLNVWWSEFQRLKWTKKRFAEAVTQVARNTSYGRVTFDMFLTKERLYTREEAMAIADEVIAQRRKDLEELEKYVPLELLEKQGLVEFQTAAARKLDALRVKAAVELKRRLRVARLWFDKQDENLKADLWGMAIKDKRVEEDQYWLQFVHELIPFYLEDVEQWMSKQKSTTKDASASTKS